MNTIEQLIEIYYTLRAKMEFTNAAELRAKMIRKIYFESTHPSELEHLPFLIEEEIQELYRINNSIFEDSFIERNKEELKELSGLTTLLASKFLHQSKYETFYNIWEIQRIEFKLVNKYRSNIFIEEHIILHLFEDCNLPNVYLVNTIINNMPTLERQISSLNNASDTKNTIDQYVENVYVNYYLQGKEHECSVDGLKELILLLLFVDIYEENEIEAKQRLVRLTNITTENSRHYWAIKMLEKEILLNEV